MLLQVAGLILFLAEKYFMYQIFFAHSSFSGHLGCFHIWAIVNSGTKNMLGVGQGTDISS